MATELQKWALFRIWPCIGQSGKWQPCSNYLYSKLVKKAIVTSVHKPPSVDSSDARLLCKNKQVNLKNKPKIGNLTKKQAQHASGKKIQQNKKSGGKLQGKAGRHPDQIWLMKN